MCAPVQRAYKHYTATRCVSAMQSVNTQKGESCEKAQILQNKIAYFVRSVHYQRKSANPHI